MAIHLMRWCFKISEKQEKLIMQELLLLQNDNWKTCLVYIKILSFGEGGVVRSGLLDLLCKETTSVVDAKNAFTTKMVSMK